MLNHVAKSIKVIKDNNVCIFRKSRKYYPQCFLQSRCTMSYQFTNLFSNQEVKYMCLGFLCMDYQIRKTKRNLISLKIFFFNFIEQHFAHRKYYKNTRKNYKKENKNLLLIIEFYSSYAIVYAYKKLKTRRTF